MTPLKSKRGQREGGVKSKQHFSVQIQRSSVWCGDDGMQTVQYRTVSDLRDSTTLAIGTR